MALFNAIGANGWLLDTGNDHYDKYRERIAGESEETGSQSQTPKPPLGFGTVSDPTPEADDKPADEVTPTSQADTESASENDQDEAASQDDDDQVQADSDRRSGNAGDGEPPDGSFVQSQDDDDGSDNGKKGVRFRRRVAAATVGVVLLAAGLVLGVSAIMQDDDEYNYAQVETQTVEGEAIDASVGINQMREDGSLVSVQDFGQVDEDGAIEVPLSVVAQDRFSVLGLVDIPGTARDIDRPLRSGDTAELLVHNIGDTDQSMRFRGMLGDNGLFDEESFELLTEAQDGDLYEVVQVEQRMVDQDGKIIAEPKAFLDEDGDIRVDDDNEPLARLVVTVVLSEVGSGGAVGYAPESHENEKTEVTTTTTTDTTSTAASNVAIDQSAKQDEGSRFHALADTHTVQCGGSAFLITGFWSQEGSQGIHVDSHEGLSPEAADAIVLALANDDQATVQYLTDEFCEQELVEGGAEELTDLRTGETIKVHNALPEGTATVEETDDTATPDPERVEEMGAPTPNNDPSKQVVATAKASDHGYTAQKVVCNEGDTSCEDTAPAAPQHDIDPEGSENRDDDAMLD